MGMQTKKTMSEERDHVPKRVEEVLIRAMKHDALAACKEKGRAYAQCCDGRTISMVWACRAPLHEYNECLHQYTSDVNLEKRKAEWLKTGILPKVPHRKPM